jgi:hypothetical protein
MSLQFILVNEKIETNIFLLFLLLHIKIMRQIIRCFQSGRAYRHSGFGNGPNGPNGPDLVMSIVFIMGTYFAIKRK